MTQDTVIHINALTKYFGRHCAVDQLTLSVQRGSVFALLGRNGSGKTTTIRTLLGFLAPTRGSATILGDPSTAISAHTRSRIGYLTEGHELYPWMTVRRAEKFQAAFYPRWNHKLFLAAADHFNLRDTTKTADLSRGQRAGLALALVLAPDPELLILDDPALGLDTVARHALLESILYLTRNADRTILLTSHLLQDVERVADTVAIIDQSVLRVCAPIDTFRAHVAQFRLQFAGNPPPIPSLPGLLHTTFTKDTATITLANPTPEHLDTLHALHPISLTPIPLSFEESLTYYLSDHQRHTRLIDRLGEVA